MKQMGESCSSHEVDDKMRIKFWLENLKGREHSENLSVDGNNIEKDLRE
jgi:hypothetical protein